MAAKAIAAAAGLALGAAETTEADVTNSGIDPKTIGIAVLVIAAITVVSLLMKKGGSEDNTSPSVQLHPKQLAYMEDKDKILSTTKGKAVRCIIDYLREATDEHVQEVLGEAPKYTDGFETTTFDMHQRQIDWLASVGVKIGTEEGEEKYNQLGKACRAMLDYAMRMEDSNQEKIKDLFDTIRCLNC